ncbi:FKBP-type peptidyl-prolyl cis-trans isomerase [Massilia sp. UMI-21]|nr:FKBP-type peptidyl-prolyl cis-trans isomerase [Massilia sp. UMI-21]
MKSTLVPALGLAFAMLAVPAAAQKPHSAPAARPAMALQTVDTVTGKGKVATAGSTVTVHYTGWLYMPSAPDRHGRQVDSSVGGEPFSFPLGAGKVIKGWDQGVAGMRTGGKRTLIIPAALGYGARGAGPIPPGANLIFDVQLLEVR